MELKGKTAVITGGASGIGLATAIQFSKAGANIVLGDIEDATDAIRAEFEAVWREDRDLPIGSFVSEDGKRRKLGSRIAEAGGKAGGNFLTPEIAHTARREAAYCEIGALIDAERLATNLLSIGCP